MVYPIDVLQVNKTISQSYGKSNNQFTELHFIMLHRSVQFSALEKMSHYFRGVFLKLNLKVVQR